MCGALEVEIAGRRLESQLPGRKGQLVAYLAVNRQRSVRREELIDALWPVDPPQRPEAAFATLLTRTRAVVGHRTISGTSHLRLELGQEAAIDWESAHRAADTARSRLGAGHPDGALAVAEDGLSIVARGFLQDHEATWIDDRRRELDELRGPLAEVLARAALALGGEHLASAERAARTMIEQNPYRETGYAVLMEILAAGGNDAEAMRTYDRLRSLLREHLGLTPSPAVTALAERVLRHQSESEASPEGVAGTGQPGQAPTAEPAELPRALAAVADRPLVGRMRESDRLLGVAEDVSTGRQRIVLISGEPGIGKTRLAAGLASTLSDRGWCVLYGRADRESVLSYQPVIEALQHYLSHGVSIDSHVVELLGPELAALSRMVPALRGLASAPPEQGNVDPELERFRVFEAVAALIASATSRCPAVLVLDDLHWADRSTMTLLRHIIRATADCPLLILGTYRDPHEPTDVPFREFADELWHAGLLEQLSLTGLDRPDSAELVRAHLPGVEEGVLAHLYERTDGNPFYLEETVRGFADAGGDVAANPPQDRRFAVPDRLKQMIEWRVERLDPPAPAILKAAAVLGPEFELARASSISRVSAEAAIEAFAAAHRAGLIVTDPERADRYAFRHALVREALYEATPPGLRARLHLAAGQELERSGGGQSQAAELAMHFSHAIHIGGAQDAVRWRLAAAEEATLRHAHEESVEHFRRALEALDATAPDDHSRATILLGQGRALIRAGDAEEGRQSLREAADLARRLGAPQILAECAIDLGAFYLAPGEVQDAVVSLLEEALDGLDDTRDAAWRSRVLARLVAALYWEPAARRRSQALAEDAVRLAEADGSVTALAQAFASRHVAHWVSERPAELLPEAHRAIELAQQAGDQELELVTRTWRLNYLLALAEVAEVDQEIDRFVGLAHRLGQSRCLWYAPLFLAIRAMMDGRLDRAERLIVKAAEGGSRVPGSTSAMLAGAQFFFLRALEGRLGELEEALSMAVANYPRQPAWRCAFAFLQSQLGRHERARELIDELAPDDFAAVPRDNIWFAGITMLAEASAASGADQHAATLERLLLPYQGVCVVSPDAAWLGPVDRVLGLLAAAQGRYDDALAHLIRASECCERARAMSILAWARLDHADVLLRRGHGADIETARALARAALTTAESSGMRAAAARALAILTGAHERGAQVGVPASAPRAIHADSSAEEAVASG
jgi:DNA-binding SARP family transcriptional activator/tetratricopeptide (TPR) repeat protein